VRKAECDKERNDDGDFVQPLQWDDKMKLRRMTEVWKRMFRGIQREGEKRREEGLQKTERSKTDFQNGRERKER
jgi:hypothetical protein